MDILSLITDPKVILIIVAVIALAAFVYVSWKKTSSSISALENSQKKIQKQLAHGVITDERINPLRVENASNMSDDTMEYNYNHDESESNSRRAEDTGSNSNPGTESQTETETETETGSQSGSEPESMIHGTEAGTGTGTGTGNIFNQFHGLVQEHQQHQQPLPGQNVLDELRNMRTKEDTVVIQEYDTDSEEPIEFQDIRDYEFEPLEDDEPVSIMAIKQQQLVEQKIKEDIERIDRENQQAQAQAQAQKPKPKTEPKIKAKSKPKPKPKTVEIKTKSKSKPKPQIKPQIKPKITVKN